MNTEEPRLRPDMNIVFPDKEKLLRKAPAKTIPLYARWTAIAASLALLVGLGAYFFNHGGMDRREPLQPVLALESKPTGLLMDETSSALLPSCLNLQSLQISQNTVLTEEDVVPDLHHDVLDMVASLPVLETTLLSSEPLALSLNGQMPKPVDYDEYYHSMPQEVYAMIEESAKDALLHGAISVYKRAAKTLMTAYYKVDDRFAFGR